MTGVSAGAMLTGAHYRVTALVESSVCCVTDFYNVAFSGY